MACRPVMGVYRLGPRPCFSLLWKPSSVQPVLDTGSLYWGGGRVTGRSSWPSTRRVGARLLGVGHCGRPPEQTGPCPPQIAVQNPLVSERLELSVLYKEYAEDDNIYQQKIKVGAWLRGRKSPGAGVGLLQVCSLLGPASCRGGCWGLLWLLVLKCVDSGIKGP